MRKVEIEVSTSGYTYIVKFFRDGVEVAFKTFHNIDAPVIRSATAEFLKYNGINSAFEKTAAA